jgi:hypothetical protein
MTATEVPFKIRTETFNHQTSFRLQDPQLLTNFPFKLSVDTLPTSKKQKSPGKYHCATDRKGACICSWRRKIRDQGNEKVTSMPKGRPCQRIPEIRHNILLSSPYHIKTNTKDNLYNQVRLSHDFRLLLTTSSVHTLCDSVKILGTSLEQCP